MKSKRHSTRMGMLMIAAGAMVLAACTTPDEPTPDRSTATAQAAAASDTELAAGTTPAASAENPAEDHVIQPRVSCRRVTASSIPVFSTPSGSGVLCHFFQGDVFSHFGFVSPPGRYITWCPRGVPPSQGTTGYAQAAGTVDGGCG